jgi:predicted RNA-binding protein with RPS1 domain
MTKGEKKYSIKIGEKESSWMSEKIVFRGTLNNVTGLYLDSIEDAKKVLSIVNAKIYTIDEHIDNGEYIDSWGKEVEATEEVIKWREDKERKEEEYDKKQKETVEKINKMPKTFEIFKDKDFVIYAERGDAEYRPGYSHKIQVSVMCKYMKIGEDEGVDLWINDYVTSNGRALGKRFAERVTAYGGPAVCLRLKEIHSKFKEIKSAIESGEDIK